VFLGKVLDLPCDIPHHADYIASWVAKLKEDKSEIFRAASEAQRIADYLLAFHPDYASEAASDRDTETSAPALAA
jgi:antirestriction protein ArdC